MRPNETGLEKSSPTSPESAPAMADVASRLVFLPIMARELRVAAKRPKTYHGRMAAAATWMAAAAYGLLVSYSMRIRGHDGLPLFQALSFALLAWAVSSAWAGCDSISAEKREGTIGFLFLTDLKSHDIVLGKMAGAALPWLYAALAALPLLAICMLMGGVTAAQYAKTGMAILSVFCLSQAVGMFSSALCRLRGNATGLPLLILMLYVTVCGATAALAEVKRWEWLATLSNLNNPAHLLYLTLNTSLVAGTASDYWLSLLVVLLHTLVFLRLAVWVLPFRWRENPKKAGLWKRLGERWRYGAMASRAARRRWLMSVNPFMWLVCRGRIGPAFAWCAMAALAPGVLYLPLRAMIQDGWTEAYEGCFVLIIIVLQLMLRVGVPSHAGLMEEHRRNGSLEIILCCSPMSAEEILQGMWLMLRRYFFRPMVFVVAVESGMFIAALIMGLRHSLKINLLCFICVSAVMLVFDLRAMAWMAMWTAMSNPKPRTAGPTALFWVSVSPWILVGACYGTRVISSPLWLWILWPMFGLMVDAFLCRLSQNLLRKNFRLWAVPSYGEVLGFWARVGRLLGLLLRERRQTSPPANG